METYEDYLGSLVIILYKTQYGELPTLILKPKRPNPGFRV